MKQVVFLVLFVFAGCVTQAQTFNEWFRQKATQKKYLLQQIAALKVYLGYVEKGYAIAQKGLTTIRDKKQGDFDLHRDFIGSLKNVNPKIGRYAKVADIIALQLKIIQVNKDVRKQMTKENLFGEKEVEYVFNVFNNVLNDCSEVIEDLKAVITSNSLEMKDDERVKRLDALYNDMKENYVFAQGFGDEVKLLGVQRKKEQADVQTSRALHDIKNE